DAFTVVVVLAEDADRRVGPLLDGVLREGRSLGDVVGVEGEGVGVDTGLVPGEGAGGDEQVGHALLVEVVEDGGVGGGAQAVDDGEDPVFGDQFAHDGLGGGGVVGVVFDDVLDVAAVDAALVVEVGEVGRGGGGDRGVACGGRAGEGLVGADGHRVVGDAGGAVVAGGAACGQCDGRRCGQGRGGRGSGGGAHSDRLSVFVEGIAVGEAVGRGSGASGGARPAEAGEEAGEAVRAGEGRRYDDRAEEEDGEVAVQSLPEVGGHGLDCRVDQPGQGDDEERADRGAADAAEPADDGGDDEHEGEGESVAAGGDLLGGDGQDRAAEACGDGAGDERAGLDPAGVRSAERGGGLVAEDGPHAQAGAAGAEEDERGHGRGADEDREPGVPLFDGDEGGECFGHRQERGGAALFAAERQHVRGRGEGDDEGEGQAGEVGAAEA